MALLAQLLVMHSSLLRAAAYNKRRGDEDDEEQLEELSSPLPIAFSLITSLSTTSHQALLNRAIVFNSN